LSFSLDDSTGRVVVKVTDSTSGEVIRQIPSEEALRLAERLDEARSLLFKAEA
ncbi:flagellar protein FlaG, partial [Pseudomonas aeruginosa]|nr:flagellar protein FlaG [Pseudomonas aeruginosa]